jgi:hypothetical protein
VYNGGVLDPPDDPILGFVSLLDPSGASVVVTTLSSLWTLSQLDELSRWGRRREPRFHEAGREPDRTPSVDGRLVDGVMHPFLVAWWATDDLGHVHLRVLPVAGPPDGFGVCSGPVLSVRGDRSAARLDLPRNVPSES